MGAVVSRCASIPAQRNEELNASSAVLQTSQMATTVATQTARHLMRRHRSSTPSQSSFSMPDARRLQRAVRTGGTISGYLDGQTLVLVGSPVRRSRQQQQASRSCDGEASSSFLRVTPKSSSASHSAPTDEAAAGSARNPLAASFRRVSDVKPASDQEPCHALSQMTSAEDEGAEGDTFQRLWSDYTATADRSEEFPAEAFATLQMPTASHNAECARTLEEN